MTNVFTYLSFIFFSVPPARQDENSNLRPKFHPWEPKLESHILKTNSKRSDGSKWKIQVTISKTTKLSTIITVSIAIYQLWWPVKPPQWHFSTWLKSQKQLTWQVTIAMASHQTSDHPIWNLPDKWPSQEGLTKKKTSHKWLAKQVTILVATDQTIDLPNGDSSDKWPF